MSYPASIEKAFAYLQAADIPKYLKNRKILYVHRMFWKKGIALPPPVLASFIVNTIYFAMTGWIMFIPVLLIIHWKEQRTISEWSIDLAIYAVIYGVMSVWIRQRQRRNLGLLSWQELQNLPDNAQNRDA